VRADPRHFRAAVTVLLGVVQAGFAHGDSRADGLDGAPRLVYAPPCGAPTSHASVVARRSGSSDARRSLARVRAWRARGRNR
jgi:hypothetical protein